MTVEEPAEVVGEVELAVVGRKVEVVRSSVVEVAVGFVLQDCR